MRLMQRAMQPQGRLASLAAMTVCMASIVCLVNGDSNDWKDGRGTWFDIEHDDPKTANCHYSSYNDIPTGRNVGAMSDTSGYFSNSCGMCIEIRCQPAGFKDGYGQWLDRNNACYDPAKSVYVTIGDACPCQHSNAYSNKRWCCGDDSSREHIDITRSAFQQLADLNQGVIALSWRQVDCNTAKNGNAYYNEYKTQPQADTSSSNNNDGNSNNNLQASDTSSNNNNNWPSTGSGSSGDSSSSSQPSASSSGWSKPSWSWGKGSSGGWGSGILSRWLNRRLLDARA